MVNVKRSAMLVAGVVMTTMGSFAAAAGVYVGVQAGHQNASVGLYDEVDVSVSGSTGGVLAGVRTGIGQNSYLAVEVNASVSMADGASGSGSKIEMDNSYGASLILGHHLTPNTSVYGRAGYQLAEATFHSGDQEWDASFTGMRYGVGIETALTRQASLRLDWSHTDYGSRRAGGIEVDPDENLVQLGVVYRF